MTNEEASFILANIDRRVCDDELNDALDVAIKALEQQPCEDCISRKQALKETKALVRGNYDSEYIVETLKMLPPVTPMAEQKAVLDKITAEIWEEAEWAYSDFDDYKEAVLEAEPDELPDDEFRFGLHRAVEIINKYKAESENKG